MHKVKNCKLSFKLTFILFSLFKNSAFLFLNVAKLTKYNCIVQRKMYPLLPEKQCTSYPIVVVLSFVNYSGSYRISHTFASVITQTWWRV